MNMKTVKKSELILNIGIVILTVIGVILMFNGKPVGMVIFAVITLSAFGAASLFRVISNKRADG